MNKKFNFFVLFVLVIALFSACKEPEISQIIPIKVSFYDGTTLIESSYKTPNTIYDFPANPQKNGYVFAGWELNGEFIPLTQKNYSLPQSSSEYIFIATWNKNSMTVSFYDGSTLIESKEILADTAYTFPPAPTKAGYTFSGWKIGDSIITLEQTTYSHEYSESGYIYDATWTPKSMPVKFYSDGSLYKSVSIVTDGVNTFPSAPTKNGYTFAGWKINDTTIPLDQTTYSHEYSESGYSYESTWTPMDMTVKFYSDGSLYETVPIVTNGVNTFPSAPTKNGYTFAGWKINDTTIPLDQTTYSHEYSESGYSYEATWTQKSMTVSFYDGSTLIDSREIFAGITYSFPSAPTKDGYAFAGWKINGTTIPLSQKTYSHEYSEYRYEYVAIFEPYLRISANGVVTKGNEIYKLNAITIPSEIDGIKVTAIGDSTFYGCSALAEITIPDSVTFIGSSAFSGCSSLTEITIPDSVTSIGGGVFYGCSALEKVSLGNGIKSLDSYEDYGFFEGCSSLTEITIPDSVTSIGEDAFSDCSALTEITIPDSVTSIGEDAFFCCSSLTEITIPDSVTSIGSYAFERSYSISSVNADPKWTSQFYISKIKKWIIPDSVTFIDTFAFSGCSKLTSVTIPDSVTYIGSYAFENCSSLSEITIPDSVTKIGNNAFEGCTALTEVTIGNSVTFIDFIAFSGCSSLTEITIPDSVTAIGWGAFSYCSSLKSIYIDKEKDSLDLSKSVPYNATVYWKGEF